MLALFESVICVEYFYSDSDWTSHFFSFIVLKCARFVVNYKYNPNCNYSYDKVITVDDLGHKISEMKFLCKTFFGIRLIDFEKSVTARNIKDPKIFNNMVRQEIISFLGESNPTPYSRLLTLSGLLTTLHDPNSEEEKVLVVVGSDPGLIEVQVHQSRFNKPKLLLFIKQLVQSVKSSLKALTFNYPTQNLTHLLNMIGSEQVYNRDIGNNFNNVFPTLVQPLLANYIAKNCPLDTFQTVLEMKLYLQEADSMLINILVLMHVTCGAPPRATELLTLSMENRQGLLRSIHVENGTIIIHVI